MALLCFVCDEPSPYPVCCDCTREGFDINNILDGSQKPKFDVSMYQEFEFRELIVYRVKAKDEAHARRKVDTSMMIRSELKVQRVVKLETGVTLEQVKHAHDGLAVQESSIMRLQGK